MLGKVGASDLRVGKSWNPLRVSSHWKADVLSLSCLWALGWFSGRSVTGSTDVMCIYVCVIVYIGGCIAGWPSIVRGHMSLTHIDTHQPKLCIFFQIRVEFLKLHFVFCVFLYIMFFWRI